MLLEDHRTLSLILEYSRKRREEEEFIVFFVLQSFEKVQDDEE